MIKTITKIFLALLFCLGTIKISAQAVVAQVSTKQVQVGVPFEYAIVVNINANTFTPPNFNGFDVVSGPHQNTSVQVINGQSSVQMTASWVLAAKSTGKFVIGPASIMAGTQKYESASVTIEVTKGSGNSAGQGTQGETQNAKVGSGDVFIITGVSRSKCYVGEQVIITQKIYSRYQIVNLQKFSRPTYDGFFTLPQETNTKGVALENVDGINYYTYELFRTTAIANKSGKITLTPVEGDVIVRRQAKNQPRNWIEQLFGAVSHEDVAVAIRSRNQVIEVQALPEQGKPENFDGAVGSFSYKVNPSRTEMKANEAFNLKITITGKGNLKLINPPKLNLPGGFETYEPKSLESGNSKTFDYLVIPRNEGDYVLSNLGFSYFDPETKKYHSTPSEEIKIKVMAPDPNSASTQVYSPHSTIKETENDIRYIKKGEFLLSRIEAEFFNSLTHIVLIILPILGLATGLFLRRNHIKNNSNMALVRERKAAKMAKKQMANAEKLMNQNKKDEFYTEILTALYNYLSHKLNIPVADLSLESIQKNLLKRQVNAGLFEKLKSTIETGEFAKYAPGSVSGDLRNVYSDTVSLITQLEQQLNKKA